MNSFVRFVGLVAVFVLSGCTCDTDFGRLTYACSSSADCTAGFSCVSGVCRTGNAGGGDSPTDAGETAGGSAGGGSAGGDSAG